MFTEKFCPLFQFSVATIVFRFESRASSLCILARVFQSMQEKRIRVTRIILHFADIQAIKSQA